MKMIATKEMISIQFLRFNRIARAHLEAENESSEHIKMNWSSWVDSLTGEKKKLELTKYRWNLENRSNSTGLPSIEASTTTSFTCHTNNCDSKINFWLIFKSQEAYLSRWSFLEILERPEVLWSPEDPGTLKMMSRVWVHTVDQRHF